MNRVRRFEWNDVQKPNPRRKLRCPVALMLSEVEARARA